jgi:hypothetical protein
VSRGASALMILFLVGRQRCPTAAQERRAELKFKSAGVLS